MALAGYGERFRARPGQGRCRKDPARRSHPRHFNWPASSIRSSQRRGPPIVPGFRLGALLLRRKRPARILRSRSSRFAPVTTGIVNCRLFQGAVVSQLLNDPNSAVAGSRRNRDYRRDCRGPGKADAAECPAKAECGANLLQCPRSPGTADARASRVDPAIDKDSPGFKKAQEIADELLAQLNNFKELFGEDKKLTLDGWEAKLIAEALASAPHSSARGWCSKLPPTRWIRSRSSPSSARSSATWTPGAVRRPGEGHYDGEGR